MTREEVLNELQRLRGQWISGPPYDALGVAIVDTLRKIEESDPLPRCPLCDCTGACRFCSHGFHALSREQPDPWRVVADELASVVRVVDREWECKPASSALAAYDALAKEDT